MFRTVLFHHQEQQATVTQQPDVPAYTGIYQMRCTAYKVAPEDGLI